MADIKPRRIKTISEFHQLRNLPAPEHPLISVVDYATISRPAGKEQNSWVFDFYSISIKRGINGKMIYGQQEYDFDEGIMFFISPNQVFRIAVDPQSTAERSGWMLLVHPDFLWNTPLAKTIKQYEYFDYSVNEALFLSEKEEAIINNIIQTIGQEYHSNIDKFSQSIIISQIETLLNYAERFYHRQFITRKITHHKILDRLEEMLAEYFNSDDVIGKGLPTVQYIARSLNVSPKYLSSLLKVLTGLTAQQHIHEKLIEKAKEKLSTTDLSVSEIAYELGFEHSQSFSKLFKSKTSLSPLEFRQSFS
ncbi:MAG TPA: helix-turn-helix transcriptional regulator [Chitinophaga sp.]|uniref:helix-turn-helix domain-containing protein n=1 Tax=Chitinophaga sp. TaxID=1869181 RepID=UPI002B797C90|nr:helix-turn-helix transcriptional regulator [Chitinophaga sp.]HVI43763.1 helix-turn-helix transcriptional regulator [Chitinophaga sp.]